MKQIAELTYADPPACAVRSFPSVPSPSLSYQFIINHIHTKSFLAHTISPYLFYTPLALLILL